MAGAPIRILVVDAVHDHADLVGELVPLIDVFSDAVLEVAASFDTALEAFERSRFDLAFVDYRLGEEDGVSLLRELRRRQIDTPVVILTSRGDEEVAVEAMRAGAADYLSKSSLSVETLGATIRHALALAVEERQRRDAEAARRLGEDRLRALVENVSDVLMLVDAAGRITWASPSSQRFLGWSPEHTPGRPLLDFVHPEDAEETRALVEGIAAQSGRSFRIVLRARHPDGSWRLLEGTGVNRLHDPAVGAIIISARDATDSRRIEEHFRQSQKMEAIGRLAGGIAHDFNNLLTAILGYANLMLEELQPDDRFRADVVAIQEAGERAASLTRQLLAFSRRQMLQPQLVDVNALVAQLERMLRRLIPEDVELDLALGEALPAVHVDPASFEQILVNLAVNARDAMPRGGRLTVETAAVELDAGYAGRHVSVVPGPYVMLAISDTGEGMDEATRARVFDPFFTTKEQGKGLGLGLSTVYGMVKQSDGYIWVYSEPAQGTVFRVYFPAAITPSVDPGAQPADAAIGGSETVLLVEDEEAVRAVAAAVLRRHGYVVIEARHGVEALQLAARHDGSIDLMVTDIVMPHLSGSDLAWRLSRVRPALRVLYMSGYTERGVAHRDLTPGAAFLQKPFTPDHFVRKVRAVLDGPAARR
jgi:two-component system cell cycle sensor histidine kinase/response regulator CckA